MDKVANAFAYYGLDVTDNLAHYGILGMKWGRRRARGPASDDHVKTRTIQKKDLSSMSNAEIKAFNERMQLESTYRTLNPTKLMRAKKLVTEVASYAESANKIFNLINSPIGKAIGSKVGKKTAAATPARAALVQAKSKSIVDKVLSGLGSKPASSVSLSASQMKIQRDAEIIFEKAVAASKKS